MAQLARAPHRDNRRPMLILELVPQRRHAGYGEGTDFTRHCRSPITSRGRRCRPSKRSLTFPRTIKGHGVLIALACEEIVMNREAELGEAGNR